MNPVTAAIWTLTATIVVVALCFAVNNVLLIEVRTRKYLNLMLLLALLVCFIIILDRAVRHG